MLGKQKLYMLFCLQDCSLVISNTNNTNSGQHSFCDRTYCHNEIILKFQADTKYVLISLADLNLSK